jgi:hypothetical protein
MVTVTQLTEDYIKKHPSIKDCLHKDVVNFSKLARKIAKDLRVSANMEAILIACRRYKEKIVNENVAEDKIIELLARSEMQIKNKIAVVIISKDVYKDNLLKIERKIREKADTFYAVEGSKVITIIVGEKYLGELKKLFGKKVISSQSELAMIIINSPVEVEETLGVMSYLYSLFSDHSVNIVETLSCWTDTILVVEDQKVATVMDFMKF